MSRDARAYLQDIVECCDRVAEYVREHDDATIRASLLHIDAVVRNIEIVGEAAKHVPAEVRALAPAVAWTRLAGMRDVVAHGYFGLDLDIVTDVAFRHLPALRVEVQALLDRMAASSS